MTTNTGLTGPTILIPKKNLVLDATILSTLMSCARLTDFRFNHHLQSTRGKSNSLEVGSIIHKGLEIAYKLRMFGHTRINAEQTGLIAAKLYADGCQYCAGFIPTETELKPKCGHSIDEYPGVQNTPFSDSEAEAYQVSVERAIKTLEEYFDYYKNDHWVTLATEQVVGKVLYEDDDIRILWKAKLDWKVDTNQGIFPVDHKTSKQRREKLKLNNQFIGQCLVMGTRQMIVNEIGLQKTLKPTEKFLRPPISYSSEALFEWQSEILPYWGYKLLDYYETGYYPPNYTHCDNKFGKCQFVEVCSSDKNMRETELRMKFIKGPEWNPSNEDE